MNMERVKQLRNEYTEQHIISKEQFEKYHPQHAVTSSVSQGHHYGTC